MPFIEKEEGRKSHEPYKTAKTLHKYAFENGWFSNLQKKYIK